MGQNKNKVYSSFDNENDQKMWNTFSSEQQNKAFDAIFPRALREEMMSKAGMIADKEDREDLEKYSTEQLRELAVNTNAVNGKTVIDSSGTRAQLIDNILEFMWDGSEE